MAVTAAKRASVFGYPGKTDRVTYLTPWGIKVVIHPLILQVFTEACEAAARHTWRPLRIDSYNNRPIRGKSGDKLEDWSLHASALAFDFFATPPNVPPPGGVWTPQNPPSRQFVECFTSRGFRWGGTFSRVDLPHIEWADGLPPAGVYIPTPSEEDDMPAPAVVHTPNGDRWSFIRGTDGQLFGKRNDDPWVPMGGRLSSGPAASVHPNGDITVEARANDTTGSIAVVVVRNGKPGAWGTLGGAS